MNLKKPTQPEEIELVLDEEVRNGKPKETSQATNNECAMKPFMAAFDSGNLSAYRAAYLKDHNLDL